MEFSSTYPDRYVTIDLKDGVLKSYESVRSSLKKLSPVNTYLSRYHPDCRLEEERHPNRVPHDAASPYR